MVNRLDFSNAAAYAAFCEEKTGLAKDETDKTLQSKWSFGESGWSFGESGQSVSGQEPVCCIQRVLPADIFSLAQSNSILNKCVTAWQNGVFSWEKAMTYAAASLAKQNQTLIDDHMRILALKIPDPVEIEGKLFVYAGPCPSCGRPLQHAATSEKT